MADADRVCPFCLSTFTQEIDTIPSNQNSTTTPDLTLCEWIPILRSLHDLDSDTLRTKIHRDEVIEKLLDAIAVINRHRGILEESFGPQLDRILAYLSGNPPSSDDLMQLKVDALLLHIDGYNCAMDVVSTVRIDQSASGEKCPICLDEFAAGEEASELPCKHVFHCTCIETWLHMQNSCPVCRLELPIDVPRFTTGDAYHNGGRSRRRGRRFWVHFRWLFCVGIFRGRGPSSAPTLPLRTG